MGTTRQLAIVLVALALGSGTAGVATADVVGPRIVGGEVAPAGAWPSIAALLEKSQPDPYRAQFCGGTLIAPTVVLTAAHCVYSESHTVYSPSLMDVAIGATSLSAITAGQRIALQSAPTGIVRHPDYDSAAGDYANDVALLNLAAAAPAPPMPVIQAEQQRLLPAGTPARIAGWGTLSWLGPFPNDLQQAAVPIVGDDRCAAAYTGAFLPTVMLCAGYIDTGGVDTCQGDSGGPLTAALNGATTLVGATSWGTGCAWAGYPGVYTRLSAFQAWLLEQPGVTAYLDTLTATPAITRVANAGPNVTVTWSVDPANWSLTGFTTDIAGSSATVDGATSSRTVAVPSGGPVNAVVTTSVTRGAGATARWTGTPTASRPAQVTTAIAGAARAGTTLTATATSDDPWAPVALQWLRGGTPIPGATTATYALTAADAGAVLAVRATATNAAGSAEARAETGPVVAAPALAVTTTATLGLRRVGGVLHLRPPTALGYPAPRISYQWLRNGLAIRKATGSTYRVVKADRGTRIQARLTYANSEGRAQLRSATAPISRAIVAFRPVPITRAVTATGTPTVGQRLRVTAPPAAGYTQPTVAYRWLRDGRAISGATGASYRLTEADRRHRIAVRITYRNPTGTATVTTRAVVVR